MVCKRCKYKEIASGFTCTRCLIKHKEFEYLVITEIPEEGGPGNMADEILVLNRRAMLQVVQNEPGWDWKIRTRR